jgi:hypothetical protein
MTDKATPRPWRISEDRNPSGWASIEVDTPHEFKTIGSMYMFDVDTNIANAALIVRAVNNFDQMKTALNRIASWEEGEVVTTAFDEPGSAEIARAVLAKIEE